MSFRKIGIILRIYRKLAFIAPRVYRVNLLENCESFVGLALRHQVFRAFGIRVSYHGYNESRQTDHTEKHPPGFVNDNTGIERYRQWNDDPC